MKVGGIEVACFLQPVPIGNGQPGAFQLNEAVGPHGFQNPVDVNRRDAERISNLRLGDRPATAMAVDQPHCPQAHQHLAQKVGDARIRFTLPDAGHPLPEDGPINERLAPEGLCDAVVALKQLVQNFMGDEPHAAWSERAEAVVQHLQVQALQVGNVAGDVEVMDLALAVSGQLVGAREAAQDQAGSGGAIPHAHDVLVLLEGHNLHRQVFERLPLIIGEPEDALQLADKDGGRE